MKVQPVIDSCFNKQLFTWGDNPALRWATNNTKRVRSGKKEGTDTGNFYYAKIEAKSRKTDPFIALVASMVVEDELGTGQSVYDDLPVIT
jgi:phage terminase large subunit-like protein